MTDYMQKARGMFTPERIESANNKVARLQCELDITNADHIALWLEANDPYEGDAWLAVQIADAYDRAHEATKAELQALREAVNNIRALAAKRQHEGGPDGTLADIEGFALAALTRKDA
jgi:hypothetical protein